MHADDTVRLRNQLFINYNLKIDHTSPFVFSSDLEAETVASGVEDPGVVVGAFHARVKPQSFPGQFPGAQWAGVGKGAVGLALDVALVLPLAEVPQCSKLSWVLHPLDHLIGREGMVNLEFWDLATM